MGKKNKKSFYKKELKPLIKNNKLLFAALGGAAAGITIAGILGMEKAKEVLKTVEDSISNATDRLSNRVQNGTTGSRTKESVQN